MNKKLRPPSRQPDREGSGIRFGGIPRPPEKQTPSLTELQRHFGGRKRFWKLVGLYLRHTTHHAVRFRFVGLTRYFLTVRVTYPCEYEQGIPLSSLASFAHLGGGGGGGSYERSEYLRSVAERPDFGGGG